MKLFLADYLVIATYLALLAAVAWYYRNKGTFDTRSYFAASGDSPWWLLGISMVATTFAADTPLAVTGIVAKDGLAGNWIWWAFMFSGMLTTVVFAPLWKRSGVITDVELISLRYSGKPASILRTFRAFYLALPINCIILGWVTLGMSKILQVLTGAPQWQVIVLLYLLTGVYIALTGIWGVLVTDAVQFAVAMAGSVIFAVLAVNHVGGLDALYTKLGTAGHDPQQVLAFFPAGGTDLFYTFLVWVGVMWWASWYPGAEPGGGGYIVQRLVSSRNEKEAIQASLLFNIAHFAVRPWPWILVALVSMVVFPDLADKETGYPELMKLILPAGFFGLMIIVFISAFVSTVSTHLNWGASYLINDVYKVFRKPESFDSTAEAEAHYVRMGQGSTLLIMALSILVSYYFDSVKGGWEILLSIGAGIGPVLILRWFWTRINAWSELSAMIAAAAGTIALDVAGIGEFGPRMVLNTAFTTVVWLVVTFLTKPEPEAIKQAFFEKINPETSLRFWFFSALRVSAGTASILLFLAGMRNLFFVGTASGLFLIFAGVAAAWWLVRSYRNP